MPAETFEGYLARVHVNPRNVIEAAAVFDRRDDACPTCGPACCGSPKGGEGDYALPEGVAVFDNDENIADRFEPVYVTDETADAINYLKHKFQGVAVAIEVYSLPSREQNLALTALEEASHWANRAVAKAAVQPKAN